MFREKKNSSEPIEKYDFSSSILMKIRTIREKERLNGRFIRELDSMFFGEHLLLEREHYKERLNYYSSLGKDISIYVEKYENKFGEKFSPQ